MDSNFICIPSVVEFIDIHDQYSYNEDLVCYFKFNDYVPHEGDRLAIFVIGWNAVKDYIVFEWVPIRQDTTGGSDIFSVTFNKHVLPKNSNEIYQICYISGYNDLHGASSPFQFTAGAVTQIPCSTIPKVENLEASENKAILEASAMPEKPDAEAEIKKLKKENAILREALNLIIASKNATDELKNNREKEIEALKDKVNLMSLTLSQAVLSLKKQDSCSQCKRPMNNEQQHKNYDREIQDLIKKMGELESRFSLQLQEINTLKSQINIDQDEYRKLYFEKVELERKFNEIKNNGVDSLNSLDMGDLRPLPPFPFALPKQE